MPKNTNYTKTKRVAILISKPFIISYMLVSVLSVFMGFYLDGTTIYNHNFKPNLILKIDKTGPISIGTELNLSYSLPKHGYFSLWNISGSGEVERLLPKPNNIKSSITINNENYIGERWIRPNLRKTKEEMLLLWTNKQSKHPTNAYYKTEQEFRRYLEMHKSDEWIEKVIRFQVL